MMYRQIFLLQAELRRNLDTHVEGIIENANDRDFYKDFREELFDAWNYLYFEKQTNPSFCKNIILTIVQEVLLLLVFITIKCQRKK